MGPRRLELLLALLFSVAAQAGCDQVLDISLRHVENSYVARQADEVNRGLRELHRALRCVDKTLDPTTSARIHRAEALAADLAGNRDRVDETLRAMVHADPWLGVLGVVPPDHRLAVRLMHAEESGAASETRKLMWPETGVVHVDGIAAAVAPARQPWVYQQIKEPDTVLRTSFVDSGTNPPTLLGDVGRKAQLKNGWKLAGVTAGIAAGALYTGAWVENQRYQRAVAAGDNVAIRDAYSMANGLTIGSIVAGSAGGTFLVVGFAL